MMVVNYSVMVVSGNPRQCVCANVRESHVGVTTENAAAKPQKNTAVGERVP